MTLSLNDILSARVQQQGFCSLINLSPSLALHALSPADEGLPSQISKREKNGNFSSLRIAGKLELDGLFLSHFFTALAFRHRCSVKHT